MRGKYIKKEDILKFIEDIKCNKDIPKNYGTLLDIMRYIRKMPSYDVDKVIEEIRKYADNIAELGGNFLPQVVIEIVKSGGVVDNRLEGGE